ncbi:MAG: hypothetical protein K6G73_10000 [Marinilabiliaceae bacterium]|nr:hypothetical protein [Marinilabiliaceae bacterium]
MENQQKTIANVQGKSLAFKQDVAKRYAQPGGYITDINLFKKELTKKNINLSSQLLNKFDSLNFNINQDKRLIVSINGVTILIVEPYDDEYVPFDAFM